jgi:hypothetical protein
LYGTDDGVYMFERPARTAPRQVLNIPEVTQIDVLEDYNLLVILAGMSAFEYIHHNHNLVFSFRESSLHISS